MFADFWGMIDHAESPLGRVVDVGDQASEQTICPRLSTQLVLFLSNLYGVLFGVIFSAIRFFIWLSPLQVHFLAVMLVFHLSVDSNQKWCSGFPFVQ